MVLKIIGIILGVGILVPVLWWILHPKSFWEKYDRQVLAITHIIKRPDRPELYLKASPPRPSALLSQGSQIDANFEP